MPNYVDALGDAVRGAIRAFHGSPYDFDAFDAAKIGTGEGNQAYGHGLYFAQNPTVALEYKKQAQRTRPNLGGEWSPQTVRDAEGQLSSAGSPELAIRQLNSLLEGGAEDVSFRPRIEDAMAYLQNRQPPQARMYDVEIAHPEGTLLDYDKPFNTPAGAIAAGVVRKHDPVAISAQTLRELKSGKWRFISPNPSYSSPHERAAYALHQFARDSGGVDALRQAGIPGIRYLDKGSRYGDAITRNYVMFPGTEDSIRILRKY